MVIGAASVLWTALSLLEEAQSGLQNSNNFNETSIA